MAGGSPLPHPRGQGTTNMRICDHTKPTTKTVVVATGAEMSRIRLLCSY